jgi:hypothetical protein
MRFSRIKFRELNKETSKNFEFALPNLKICAKTTFGMNLHQLSAPNEKLR